MCLIVDANVAALVFPAVSGSAFEPIWKALTQKRAIAVYGGKLASEYFKINKIFRFLAELNRQGTLRKFSAQLVSAETNRFASLTIQSDDPHILGLASVSNARLLCSNDQALHADFTDPNLISPRGSVYQNRSHSSLISKHCTQQNHRSPKKRKLRKRKH